MTGELKCYALSFKFNKSSFFNDLDKKRTVLILANNESELEILFKNFLDEYDGEIDKRAICWAGDSIPLVKSNSYTLLNCDIDEGI